MQRCAFLFCVAVAAACSFNSVAYAQQLKPYFLVIVDTSGSMAWCAGGTQANPNADCSCHQNNNCASGFNSNSCGFGANKIGDAKCALQKILDSTGGDAVWGLMQFEHPCQGGCTDVANPNSVCGTMCASNGSGACDEGQLAVALQSNSSTVMREWVDGQCQGSCGANSSTHELVAGQWTPIARSLEQANTYLRGGSIPSVTGTANNPVPLVSGDQQLACRPVSVILLTDGDDTCSTSPASEPQQRAAALYAGQDATTNPSQKRIKTYVIGFGNQQGNFNPTVLNGIASSGGTNMYLSATNEQELSLRLNQIVADAQPPVEECDKQDNDCDGKTDEGVPHYCDKPNGITGDGTDYVCDERPETNCDGIDDDCDGKIDEGLTNACGTCGDLPKEMCNGIDDDCDSRIDEETSNLEGCGTDVGECEKGKLVCVDGVESCQGARGPGKEVCDCLDNDCDGNVDEDSTADPLCPETQKCTGCKCQDFCRPVMEFGNVCAAGLAPDIQPSGECVCVVDNCNSTECAKQTKQQGGETICAPNDARVGNCVCQGGECVGRCVGKTCDGDTVCSPKTGDCVENSCRGLGCASGQLCDPVSVECVTDKCADAKCAAGEVCRAGTCEKSCAGVRCGSGQSCSRGECRDDKCKGKTCGTDQVCNPADGECITDACALQLCPKGQACSVETGMCEADPCWDLKCPSGQSCSHGECVTRGSNNNSDDDNGNGDAAGSSGGGSTSKPPSRLFATGGGGGCSCSVPGRRDPSPSSPTGMDPQLSLLGLGFGCLVALRLRRRRKARVRASSTMRRLTVLGILALACTTPLLAACKVKPQCLDLKCGNGAGSSGTPSRNDAATTNPPDAGVGNPIEDAGSDSGELDAEAEAGPMTLRDGSLPMCTPTGPETCNGKDDDCDFRVDEMTTAPANNCKQQGVCAGTSPTCSGGKFICRYSDPDHEDDETKCDGKDNDCDGKVDESFPALGMPCEVGIGACKVTGTRMCNAAGTGLSCSISSPKDPGEEVCNGVDDDCDGMIDEPKAEPGSNPSYVHDDLVQVKSDLWVYKYEASRADATNSNAGILNARACSRAGVLPWTDLKIDQAKAACEASGLVLCDRDDWSTACKGPNNNCAYSYTSGGNCTNYPSNGQNACNGHDVNAAPGSPDTDALKPTGSLSNCFTDFASAGKVFDLSGNAKELTIDSTASTQIRLRGGSYNNAPSGLQCDFDFSVGDADLHLPNVGFRCCTNTAP